MKPDIILLQKNYSTTIVQANLNICSELSHYFSAFAPNYRFMPLYKSGMWDGRLRFFNNDDHSIPSGLIEKVYEFAAKGNYKIQCDFNRTNEISYKEFNKFVDSLDIPLDIREYQLEAAYQAICKKTLNIHISTAGGKSLVIYIICRFLCHLNKKVIIVVPTTQLTEQMKGDFESYGWDADKYCHTIYSGQQKVFEAPVICSTWQSIYKDKKLFANFDALIIDEAQSAKSKELQSIAKHSINGEYRFGFSGTFPEKSSTDWFAIVGALGPIQTFATYKSLQADGHIAQIKIFAVQLKYNKNFKIRVYQDGKDSEKRDYQKENDLIYNNEDRSKFLCKMVQKIDGNVLVLFQKREKHGHVLKELFERELKDKKILYIDGSINVLDRNEYRAIMEKSGTYNKIFHFGEKSITVHENDFVELANGSKKKAKDITLNDDISDIFINKYINAGG